MLQVSADSTYKPANQQATQDSSQAANVQFSYRALVELDGQDLHFDRISLSLTPGMQVAAEIKLVDQTIMEYVLSPLRKAFHEAARER